MIYRMTADRHYVLLYNTHMDGESPTILVRRLVKAMKNCLAGFDPYGVDARQRTLVLTLKRAVADIRLDVRDYELAEKRPEQSLRHSAVSAKLQQLRNDIVSASQYGIFSALDVVQLSTWIDNLLEQLV